MVKECIQEKKNLFERKKAKPRKEKGKFFGLEKELTGKKLNNSNEKKKLWGEIKRKIGLKKETEKPKERKNKKKIRKKKKRIKKEIGFKNNSVQKDRKKNSKKKLIIMSKKKDQKKIILISLKRLFNKKK
ncbi:hypothetical protein RhiirA1_393840 [Rhizophagus irregularis]|uniref:Uncharacterized protein n=1 Tax=Rhizophagus irregularis TaxID=588596 RepID=A0A2N0RVF4_9GLOM|nr:hypothetical protein RhiirA1_393840 [Rhizophagus irregularis]